jgi:hypothetical protein
MSLFIPADIIGSSTRALAHSALPDAPVEPDEPRRIPPARRLAAWLRGLNPRTRYPTELRAAATDHEAIPATHTC